MSFYSKKDSRWQPCRYSSGKLRYAKFYGASLPAMLGMLLLAAVWCAIIIMIDDDFYDDYDYDNVIVILILILIHC